MISVYSPFYLYVHWPCSLPCNIQLLAHLPHTVVLIISELYLVGPVVIRTNFGLAA